MSDDFLSNRKEDWAQLKYLLGHKYNVYKHGRELDVPRIPLLLHDMRKFSPKEWDEYREYWFDKPNKQDIENFKRAVRHHKANNPHHHYQNAPLNVQLEAVADWYSAGPKKQIPFNKWVKSNMNNFQLSDKTKNLLTEKLAADMPPDVNWGKMGPSMKIPPKEKGKAFAKATESMGKGINALNKLAPWATLALMAVSGGAHAVKALKKPPKLPIRKGVLGKVQQFGIKHNNQFIYENPGLTLGATAGGLGLMGSNLLD